MFRKIAIYISFLILLYGLAVNNPFILEDKEKAMIGIALYALPLIIQFTKIRPTIKIYFIWFGIFLILLSITFAALNNNNYVTLKPNINVKFYHKPGTLCDIEGYQQIITDSHGFRITKDIDYGNKAANKYRIFAIGGSTTEMVYLDQQKIWTNLLQDKLDQKFKDRDFEVINTGLSGIRAINHIATLRKIINYHPDMVIFLVGINDWSYDVRNHFDLSVPTSRFVLIADKLSFKITWNHLIVPIRDTIKFKLLKINNEKEKFSEKNLFQSASLFKEDKRQYKPDEVSEEYKTEMEEINNLCDQYKIKCVFLTQPNGYKTNAMEEYRKLFWMTPAGANYTLDFTSMKHISEIYNQYLKNYAKEHNKILCDLDAKIPATVKYMCDDCHFTLKGSRKVAEEIFSCIQNNL